MKKLRFQFDETWDEVFVWDESIEFVRGAGTLKGTHAVDIVGRRYDNELWLIEVKDPRGYQAEYRKRGEDPRSVTSEKARDTVAGIVWATGRFPDDRARRLAKTLLSARRDGTGTTKVFVVLWLEGIDEAAASAHTTIIEGLLKWMNPTVIVADRRLWPMWSRKLSPGVSVGSLPGAAPRAGS